MASITTRAGKGAPLTNAEVDANFTNLNTDKAEVNQTVHVGTTAIAINRASAAQTLTGVSIDGNAGTATTLATARNIALTGAVTGNANFDGSGNISIATTHTADPVITLTGDVTGSGTMTNLGSVSITATVADDSHNHVISNVDGLQTALDAKAPLASPALTGTPTAPTVGRSDASTALATTAFAKNLFGAATTGGTTDWNDASNTTPGTGNTLLLGTATNGPGGSVYFHPVNFEYSSKTGGGNLTQFAVGYNTLELYQRYRFSSSWTSWVRILNSNNFNSFAPTLTGTGASGTWGISITGNAATVTNGVVTTGSYADPAWITSINYSKLTGTVPTWNQNTTGSAATLTTARTISLTGDVTGSTSFDGSQNVSITATVADDSHNHVISNVDGLQTALDAKANTTAVVNSDGNYLLFDTRSVDTPTDLGERGVKYEFKTNTTDGLVDGGTYHSVMTVQNWQDSSGGTTQQLGFTTNGNLWYRSATIGAVSWGTWKKFLHDANYTDYTVTKTGTGASGTWGISITGNAATVTNGVYTSGDQTIGGAKTFTSKVLVSLNTSTPTYNTGHLELFTSDGSSVSMGFHRGGFTACQLRHDSNGLILSGTTQSASADFTATGNVTAFSDIRLKTDLQPIPDALNKVSQLTGYTYTRIDSGERQTGLVAQEVQKVLPEAVLEGEHLSLAYGNMVGLLVEAIKELRAEVVGLKAQLEQYRR